MTYALYSAQYDATLANALVSISNRWTGVPAIIMAGPTGGVVNTQGNAQLDAQARLNVYIDTAQEWTVSIPNAQTPPYTVIDPKQVVTLAELTTLIPQIGKTYVLSQPPFTEYTWDGENLIASLTGAQTNLIQSLGDSNLSNITFNAPGSGDGAGKINSYIKSGIQHDVTYPDSTTVIISNSTGLSKIIGLDVNGLVTSII
jgi:hypothetical protein